MGSAFMAYWRMCFAIEPARQLTDGSIIKWRTTTALWEKDNNMGFHWWQHVASIRSEMIKYKEDQLSSW